MSFRKFLFIIDSTGVGGVEKRFSYLFKYLAQSPCPVDSSDFLVNNKLFEEIESYQTPVLNDKIRLFTFGTRIKSTNRILAGLIYLIEYFGLLSFRLLKSRKYDSLVFVTTKSLKYRNLFRCKN